MRKTILTVLSVIMSVVVLTGCVNLAPNCQRWTAKKLGNNLDPDKIKITEWHQDGWSNTFWTAVTPDGKNYTCSKERHHENALCVIKSAD
jgi:hypothetical protein